MSLMGIDVGTTGCKAIAFSAAGQPLAEAYEEYDVRRPEPGWAELDSAEVWDKVRRTIAHVAADTRDTNPIEAIAVSSMGEAMVPVTRDRRILGPSLLNFDARGDEFLDTSPPLLDARRLYNINGNTPGNHYALTKLLWLQKHHPAITDAADHFLLWGSFVPFMLGAEPAIDYSLANRTLLFDLEARAWSDALIAEAGLDAAKFPRLVPTGTRIGQVAPAMADELGLPSGVALVAGPHDQCANALGCGVLEPGNAMYGMGTVICIVPVFRERPDAATMMAQGLNTEHHALADRYVSFIYNLGGALLKWFRDTFAAEESRRAAGRGIYPELLAEMPDTPSGILALPHFGPTGPPEFIADASGVLAGLTTATPRGEVLKGILEGATFYLRRCVENLPDAGIGIDAFRAVGGGSRSPEWVQLSADILGRPFRRTRVAEAGALGAAMLAGIATGHFATPEQAAQAMVRLEDHTFEPNPAKTEHYHNQFARYEELWRLLEDFLRNR